MNLKKLTPELVSGIIDAGFDKAPREIQSLCIPKIKSGADLFIVAPEGAGKTTSIIISVIQELKESFEEAPRVIVIVETREKAYAFEEQFQILAKHTNLRSFIVFDKGNLQYQKDMIYEGLDLVIGTPKRINELLSIMGIPLTKVKMVVVDDADMHPPSSFFPVIYRLADGINKSQFLIFTNKWSEKLDNMSERMMKNPQIIKTE